MALHTDSNSGSWSFPEADNSLHVIGQFPRTYSGVNMRGVSLVVFQPMKEERPLARPVVIG